MSLVQVAGLGMAAIQVFPQSLLAIIPLIGGVVCVVVSRPCAGYEVGLPFCSVAIVTLSGTGSATQLLD